MYWYESGNKVINMTGLNKSAFWSNLNFMNASIDSIQGSLLCTYAINFLWIPCLKKRKNAENHRV